MEQLLPPVTRVKNCEYFYVSCRRQHQVAVAQQSSPKSSSIIIDDLMWATMSLARIKIFGRVKGLEGKGEPSATEAQTNLEIHR